MIKQQTKSRADQYPVAKKEYPRKRVHAAKLPCQIGGRGTQKSGDELKESNMTESKQIAQCDQKSNGKARCSAKHHATFKYGLKVVDIFPSGMGVF